MAGGSNPMTGDFTGKPTTQAFVAAITEYVAGLGPVTREVKAQVSFAVDRKFLWLWAYERTADGTLYLNVTLDHRHDDPHLHGVSQVSTNRWNHHVVVRSAPTASSGWLRDLIRAGYAFAHR